MVNTHLSLTSEKRLEFVKITTEAIIDFDKPVFIIGDLNTKPYEEPIKWLEDAKWIIINNKQEHTFPATDPNVTIDYVLGYEGKNITCSQIHSYVIEDRIASDYRPIFVNAGINDLLGK